MKSWPKVKLCQVEVGSNISQNNSSSPYEEQAIIGQNSHENLNNLKLGQVIIYSNLVLSTLTLPQNTMFVHI